MELTKMSNKNNMAQGGIEMRGFRIFLIALVMIIFSAVSHANIMLDRVVAVVNKEVITWSELYRTMESDASPQVKEMKEEERRKVFKENESAFLETLINVKLQLQEAGNMRMGASEEEINEAIEDIKKKYSMTGDDFKESLKKEGFTFEEYKKRLREQLIISKIVNKMIRNKILISEEDIRRFIEENKGLTDITDSYRISQIIFKRPKNIEEKNNIEEKAAVVLKRLKEGVNFKDLAKQYSEDPSAKAGGDIGLIKKEYLSSELTEVVSKMRSGEVSSPFWTDKGLHIIMLDEKIATKDQNEIREEARKILGNKIFMEKHNAWIKELREKSFIEIRL